ncbi:MAG: F0F1 ATP synthase subunit A [Candidatus Omnitrophica bacterium]|nr:F0F1 ATP synthase subunit A [Candidatus Omnitrophota bacterium]MBI3022087.1 F0F1 ATP synthase subunit A [Candidatus Omnitrophota bacterium]MBI3083539.1 F0F1 ATP synthase subunit A [Candidatus Omnitrophota bacterium]
MMDWCPVVWAAEGGETMPEAPNLVTVVLSGLHEGPVSHWLHAWENVVFAILIACALAGSLLFAVHRSTIIPGRAQALAELIVETFEQAFVSSLGSYTRRFLPFLGTLFLYILAMNWAVLIPGLKSPTGGIILKGAEVISGGFVTTAALALAVFCYVQFTAIRFQGLLGYLHHLMGSPRGLGEWFLCLVTLAPVTHILGELVRPVSLALRLFGNVTGDDILLGVFFVLGLLALGRPHAPVGLPLHLLIVPLVLLFGFVQAMIFTWLTSAYLSLALPHGRVQHKGGD